MLLGSAPVSRRFSLFLLLTPRCALTYQTVLSSWSSSGTAFFCSTVIFASYLKINKKTLNQKPRSVWISNPKFFVPIWEREFRLLRVPCSVFYYYPRTFNMKTVWSVVPGSSSCGASSGWVWWMLSSIARVLQNTSQPAEVLSLNWCLLLLPTLSRYFLEGIPDERCEPFAFLWSWFLLVPNLSRVVFLRFSSSCRGNFFLSFIQAPSHPGNPVLPALPVGFSCWSALTWTRCSCGL